MNIEIQDAAESDLEDLVRIYSTQQFCCTRQMAQEYVGKFFDYHCIKVAKIDGVIKAVCSWEVEVERGWGVVWMDSIWVDWEYLGKGLGKSLLNSVIGDIKASSEEIRIPIRKIVAILEQRNEAMRNLFEKIGFVKRANIGEIYNENEHALVFVKDVLPTPPRSRKSGKNPKKQKVHGKRC